ncbi:MAG TPA: hypothetical protein PLJ37_11505 [Chitinophagales bacterium]|nr:hypothetical protein [Chitinophagales bacterium]HMZ69505.1 hypothetical protein [Chitinophagales bacterium]HMZ95357.1 hypothetical protein [Chitinophagales bacterium]HNC64437.1 hypothetical protein [Chitinophagales bacterium]HNE87316.1 hypothetical protein [Chitinophagales bacterium]
MTLREKINEIRKAVVNNGSNDKMHLLNNLLAEQGILIVPKNVNRKVIDEGRREHTNGAPNTDRFHQDIRNDYSYELSCDFIITDENEEIVFPSVQSFHVAHGDLLKMAYNTVLYILFGVEAKNN